MSTFDFDALQNNDLFTTNTTGFRVMRPQLDAVTRLSALDPLAQKQLQALASELAQPNFPKLSGELKNYLAEPLLDLLSKLSTSKVAADKVDELANILALDTKTSLMTEVRELLDKRGLDFNQKALLNQPAIFDYLFAYAVYEQGFTDAPAIARYMSLAEGHGGVKRVYNYIATKAVEDYVRVNRLEVGTTTNLLNNIRPELEATMFSFRPGAFEEAIKQPIQRYAFDKDSLALITEAVKKLDLVLSPDETTYLVKYFKQSLVPLTKATAEYLVPITLMQHRNAKLNSLSIDTTVSGKLDFSVKYHTEPQGTLAINQGNVLCAAQLFYVMSLGDELGVFDAMDQFIKEYLVTGEVDIQSPQLSHDLQNYALNDEFPDLTTGRMLKRTHAQERRMFYRQVFNYGNVDLMEGMVVNPEFESLWNVLMIETVKYMEKIESSERPESHVSRQYIAQAIEDIQYNLSTHTSGMVKLLTPIMYKELDFILERVFKHRDIVSQLALHNSGSYWKVVERLLHRRYQSGVSVSALRNKAMYGHQILKSISEYTPVMINQDQKFIEFVGVVEAFIITGEQLEDQQNSLFGMKGAATNGNGTNDTQQNTNGAVADMWNF